MTPVPQPDDPLKDDPAFERALESAIAPWLDHMRWRTDFAEWRTRRLWQENYQSDTVREVTDAAASRNLTTPLRLLDLGAGMGGFAVAMQRTGAHVIALDYNPAYCRIAQLRAQRYALTLSALVGAGEALPFASGAFQIVTCWDVLEHCQDPRHLLSEIARVLTADGLAFVTVINRFALTDPHYHLRGVNYLPRPAGEKYIAWRNRTKNSALRDKQTLSEMHYFTYPAFTRLAADYGMSPTDLNRARSRFNRYPPPLSHALYGAWRTLGMGTFRLVLAKTP